MRLGKYSKSPDEAKRYLIEYSDWLDTGEYISTINFSVISTNDGVLNITPDTIGANKTAISFLASGGIAGQTYDIAVTMTTTASQTKQDTILFTVRSL